MSPSVRARGDTKQRVETTGPGYKQMYLDLILHSSDSSHQQETKTERLNYRRAFWVERDEKREMCVCEEVDRHNNAKRLPRSTSVQTFFLNRSIVSEIKQIAFLATYSQQEQDIRICVARYTLILGYQRVPCNTIFSEMLQRKYKGRDRLNCICTV